MREFCGQRLSRRTELNKAKQGILEHVETMTHGSYFTQGYNFGNLNSAAVGVFISRKAAHATDLWLYFRVFRELVYPHVTEH